MAIQRFDVSRETLMKKLKSKEVIENAKGDVCFGHPGRGCWTGKRAVQPQCRARSRPMGLLRLQDNPLVHLVSRNSLRQMACTRRALQLLSRRHVRELQLQRRKEAQAKK